MYPPSYICREIARLDPRLRLAWWGSRRANEDDLNAGSFAIVEIRHKADVGTPGEPTGVHQFWGHQDILTPLGELDVVASNRGPVFAKDGSTNPDWDPLFEYPILKARLTDFTFDGEKLTNAAVFNGLVLRVLKYWLTPIKPEMEEDARRQGKDLLQHMNDIGDEATKHFRYLQNKTNASGPQLAYKFKKKYIEQERRAHEAVDQRLLDHYSRNIPRAGI